MENAHDVFFSKSTDEACTFLQIWHQHVEHVVGLFAVCLNHRQAYTVILSPGAQLGLITLPDLAAPFLDLVYLLQLGAQHGRQYLGWQVTRTDIHPGVLIHLAPEEAAAVGAFFTDDLGALNVFRIIDQKRPTLSTGNVLGFVKTLGGQAAKTAKLLPLVLPRQPMGIIFHYFQIMPMRNIKDGVHLAAHPGIMHWHDGPGFRGDQGFQLVFIHVQRVWAVIAEDRSGSP